MSLNSQRVRTWDRADGTESLQYVMSVDDLVTDANELRAAIDADMRIAITVGFGPKSVTSLSFLAPIIHEVRDLWVGTVNRVTDVNVLTDARNLRSLSFSTGATDGRPDLSKLPHLEEFEGPITRVVASALQNPGLRFLCVEGAIPKSFMRVAGPVEIFEQRGARSQVDLPDFARPDALRTLLRAGPSRFDLAQLAKMTGLVKLSIGACDDVVGLSRLAELTSLERIEFNGCDTTEKWDDLPMVPWGFLLDVSPAPSSEFVEERRQAGWLIPDILDPASVPALVLDEVNDEDDDDDSWGVFMSRFTDLADAAELLDEYVAVGMLGEYFLLGIVSELRFQGAHLDPVPDSEGSFTAVYFPDRDQAERVFARAEALLAADPQTQARYIRAGSPD